MHLEISMSSDMHIDDSLLSSFSYNDFDVTLESITNISTYYALSNSAVSNEIASLFKRLRIKYAYIFMNLGEHVNGLLFSIFSLSAFILVYNIDPLKWRSIYM